MNIALTQREKDTLYLISEGKQTSEIAQQLYLSADTIKDYRKALMRKFQARNSPHLVKLGMQYNFISQ